MIFKVGDRVVLILEDNTIFKNCTIIGFCEKMQWYEVDNYPVKARRFRESCMIREEIYDSPLYKALREY